MRPSVRDLVGACAGALPLEGPVLEFGSFQVQAPEQEGINDLRPLLPGLSYVGADLRRGPGVDVLMDLHSAGARTGSVGTVLVIDTLEHVEYPHRALEEVHRVLAPRGAAIVTTVMDFPIHEHPSDYWRFTPEGMRSLLRPFAVSVVEALGEPRSPHTVVGVGLKGPTADEAGERLTEVCDAWRARWDGAGDQADRSVVGRLVPPIVHELRGRVRR